VGGLSINYNSNFKLGKGKYFVIEGDEYDSAYFEKFPKFIRYQPHHAILTSLEFDHADIYANVNEIKKWFKYLLNIISSNGIIVYSNEDSHLSEIISSARSVCKSFGLKDADYNFKFAEYSKHFSKIELASKLNLLNLETHLFGDFNYSNICAASAMALELGVDKETIIEAVKTFRGVKRRQEILIESKDMIIYEDFAHHPTAIENVLSSMKSRYPNSQIWAVYEPRSATSRRNVFQSQLPQAFSSAQTIILMAPFNMDKIALDNRIDINHVYNELILQGKDAWLFDNSEEIANKIIHEPKDKHTVAVIMSNGEFNGLYDKIRKLKNNLY
jgi:UDP-N-acetylmuramate: L-alanyl-gamma-D-glutamyl-meso-diaminopimelate ligase